MRPIQFPVLLVIFILSFSGKTPADHRPSSKSPSYITIWNMTGIHVKALVVIDPSTGNKETLSNPTFPYLYRTTATDLAITACFDYPSTGNLEMPNATRCTRFEQSTTATISFNADSGANDIYVMNEGVPEDCYSQH